MTQDAADVRFMRMALGVARRGLGRVAPNPAVGCVLVRDGHVLARGWTAPGGRPHAETQALARAGAAARGATAYVTLEPCAHEGETPSCAAALIAAGVVRVVAAVEDPDPRTAGKGLAALADAGIAVTRGVCEAEAAALNRGFFLKVLEHRPLVALKLATSLDGRIASRSGSSRWITGDAARRHGHLLRARFDAILVGRGTVLADDPDLRCRLPGLEDRSPVRVVLSRGEPVPKGARLLDHLDAAPVLVLTPQAFEDEAAANDGWLHPREVLEALALRGITRLLVEGGATTAAHFLRAGLVDRLYLYRAPALVGGDGLAAIGPLGVDDVSRDMPRFRAVATRALGSDRLDVYERAEEA